jgi:hypothetical protein
MCPLKNNKYIHMKHIFDLTDKVTLTTGGAASISFGIA